MIETLSKFQQELMDAASNWRAAAYHWGTLVNKHDAEGHIAGGKENDAEVKFRALVLRAVDLHHPNENLCGICQINLKDSPP